MEKTAVNRILLAKIKEFLGMAKEKTQEAVQQYVKPEGEQPIVTPQQEYQAQPVGFEQIKQAAFEDEMQKLALSTKLLARAGVKAALNGKSVDRKAEKYLMSIANKLSPDKTRRMAAMNLAYRSNASAVRNSENPLRTKLVRGSTFENNY